MPITITKLKIDPVVLALSPTLKINVTIKNQGNPCDIFFTEGEFYIKDAQHEVYVTRLHSNLTDRISFPQNNDLSLSFDCSMTFSDLNAIEEIRKGQKLYYRVKIYINCWETNKVTRYVTQEDGKIEKSAWVEDILGAIGYGKIDYLEFRFNELYKDERIEKELEYFHKAIDEYNRGNYDGVLVECRKVMQGIESKEDALQLSEKLGEENYNRAVKAGNHYLSLGAHSETQIKAKVLRADAEFALSTILGFLRFVTSIFKNEQS